MLTLCTQNSQYNDLISKVQNVCVCVGVRVWWPRLLSVRNRNRHAHSARTREGLRKNMHKGPSQGVDPSIKFLDDANATHSSSFQHTPTPVLCRLYATSSFPKLPAIEYVLPTKLTLLALSFLSKFRSHLHRIQPTRSLQQALHGECAVSLKFRARSITELVPCNISQEKTQSFCKSILWLINKNKLRHDAELCLV